jgi:hypothetical protein
MLYCNGRFLGRFVGASFLVVALSACSGPIKMVNRDQGMHHHHHDKSYGWGIRSHKKKHRSKRRSRH